nr:hypothetical protein [Massilia sp. SGZ-792]
MYGTNLSKAKVLSPEQFARLTDGYTKAPISLAIEFGLRREESIKIQPGSQQATFTSMADITVIGGLVFAAIVNLDIPPECTAMIAWYERMKQRESVASQPAFSGQNNA